MRSMMKHSLLTIMIPSISGCTEDLLDGIFSEFGNCHDSHERQSLISQQGCLPRPVPVILPYPTVNNSGWTQMTPTHIEVLQCTGACHGMTSCIPTVIQHKEVSVMLGKCGINEGKCQKECAVVKVEEHTECQCACQLSTSDCPLNMQKLNRDTCECDCSNKEEKHQCLNQNKIWNEANCSCKCKDHLSCSIGHRFSEIT